MPIHPLIYIGSKTKHSTVVYPNKFLNDKKRLVEIAKTSIDIVRNNIQRNSFSREIWIAAHLDDCSIFGFACSAKDLFDEYEDEEEIFVFTAFIYQNDLEFYPQRLIDCYKWIHRYIDNISEDQIIPVISDDCINTNIESGMVHLNHSEWGEVAYFTNYSPIWYNSELLNYNLLPDSWDVRVWSDIFFGHATHPGVSIVLDINDKEYALQILRTGIFNKVTCLGIDEPIKI